MVASLIIIRAKWFIQISLHVSDDWMWVDVCVFLSAVEMFQHHCDLPVSAGWADQSAGSGSCWDRLFDRGTTRFLSCFGVICHFFGSSGHNEHPPAAFVFVFLNVCALVVFQVWKVKKAFKIHVIWRGLTPTFLVNLTGFSLAL